MNIPDIYTWLAVLATGALSAMVYLRRPPAPLWPSLFFVSFTALLWTLGEGFSSFVVETLRWHHFWLGIEYTGVLLLPATWWLFGLRFAELHGHRLRRAGGLLRFGPFVLAIFFWLSMVTNPWHGLFLTPHVGGRSEFRPIWYAQTTMGYLLILAILGLFFWMRTKARDAVLREQLAIMLAATAIPLVSNALYITGIIDPGFGITASALGVSMILFFTGIYRDRLFALSSISMQHLIEHESDGMLVMDRQGRLLHFNPAAVRLLDGGTLTPDAELFPILARHLRSQDGETPMTAQRLAAELEGGNSSPGGSTYPCEGGAARWLNLQMVPIPDRGGRLLGTGIRLRDVSALHEAREKVTEQATVLEAILGSAEQGMLVVGDEGALIYSNRAFQEMWSIPDEIMSSGDDEAAIAHALQKLVDPDAFLARVRELYRDPRAESREEIRLLDGRIFERSSRPLMKEGGIAGRLWSFFDVSKERNAELEQRRLEQRMQQAQKMESLGILAGGIAHDFNNLLVGIVGNADIALRSMPADSDLRGPLEDILESSQRAAELTNQMLAYSGRGSFVVGTLDLSRLVDETGHLLEAVISKNADMVFALEDVPAVEGDGTQLRQVVMNLITNASDALEGRRGSVRVVTRLVEADAEFLAGYHFGDTLREGSYVCLEVSDTGTGMDEETAARIFDPFFTTKFTGRGLGLAAVLGIVRAHRGAIQVQSQVGRGTTFRLLLPPAGIEPSEPEPDRVVEPEPWQGTGRVLVVDDEPGVLRMVARTLVRAGFEAVTAQNGREALERYREHGDEFVAVILDLTMPGLGGEETFTALRELGASLPIILSSGYSENEVRATLASEGPSAFLQKPYTTNDLLGVLRSLIESSPPGRDD